MTPILEPITAGLVVSLINRFLLPRIEQCLTPSVDVNDGESDSSENSAINAEVHIHTH
jgi:hypothetical protein